MHLQRGTTTDIFFTIAVTISAPSPFVCCSASPSQLAAAANKNGSPQFAFRDGMRRSTVTCFNPFSAFVFGQKWLSFVLLFVRLRRCSKAKKQENHYR